MNIKDMLDLNTRYDIYDEIRSSTSPIYIWGVGSIAKWTLNALRERGIEIAGFFVNTDSYNVDPLLSDAKVLKLEEVVSSEARFNVVVGHSRYELAKQFKESCDSVDHIWMLPAQIGSYAAMDKELILNNMTALQETYDMLADDESKRNMIDYLNAHLTENEGCIVDNFTHAVTYFDNDVMRFDHSESYLDAGAHRGESIEGFMKAVDGKYDRILGVEIQPDGYRILQQKFGDHKDIKIINIGMGDHEGISSFCFYSQATHLSSDGNGVDKPVSTLDAICQEEKFAPTVIKFCISASIMPILEGARMIISEDRPKIVMVVGLDSHALFRYPQKLNEIAGAGAYSFYLRFTGAMTHCLVMFAVPR